jgi:4-carboxymuconolactone decarboxylase
VVEAIRTGARPAALKPDEAAVYDYCSELLASKFVGEPAYAAALGHLAARGIVELTCLLGYYTMVAMSLNAHGQSAPPGTGGVLPPLS